VGNIVSAFTGNSLFTGGSSLIQSWINGMLSKLPQVSAVATTLALTVARKIHGSSPPPEGPLSQIDTGGANVIKAWVDGLLSQMSAVTGASNQLAYAAVPSGGPSMAFLGTRQAFMGAGQGGVTNTTVDSHEESDRILRLMLAALGLNNELTAQSVTNRPRAISTVGAKGVIGTAKAAAGGRI
jgi:hypothetical protein